jgi:hypothetical protein
VLAIFKVANKRPAYWWRHQVIELTTSYALSQSAQCADRWLAHGNWAASATKPAAAPSSTIRCALLYALQTCLPRPISVISCFCPHQWCVSRAAGIACRQEITSAGLESCSRNTSTGNFGADWSDLSAFLVPSCCCTLPSLLRTQSGVVLVGSPLLSIVFSGDSHDTSSKLEAPLTSRCYSR